MSAGNVGLPNTGTGLTYPITLAIGLALLAAGLLRRVFNRA